MMRMKRSAPDDSREYASEAPSTCTKLESLPFSRPPLLRTPYTGRQCVQEPGPKEDMDLLKELMDELNQEEPLSEGGNAAFGESRERGSIL